MDINTVLAELRRCQRGYDALLKTVDRKRSWRDSEKAFTKADYSRRIHALGAAILALSGDWAKPDAEYKVPGSLVRWRPEDNGRLVAVVTEDGGYPYPLLYVLHPDVDPTDEMAVLTDAAQQRVADAYGEDPAPADVETMRDCLKLHMVLPVAAGIGADFRD